MNLTMYVHAKKYCSKVLIVTILVENTTKQAWVHPFALNKAFIVTRSKKSLSDFAYSVDIGSNPIMNLSFW